MERKITESPLAQRQPRITELSGVSSTSLGSQASGGIEAKEAVSRLKVAETKSL